MPISQAALERLRADYFDVTRQEWNEFYCPIMHEHGVGTGLIDGHVLPETLKDASRATVIQRADVDNYFGHTIEPDLIDFLNSETFSKAEFLRKARNITLTPPDGIPAEPFVAPPKSKPPFPRIVLNDKTEGVVGTPHVKTTWENLGGKSGVVRVEGELAYSRSAVHGGIVKSAYLGLFRLLGYKWAMGASGRYVAGRLAAFVRDQGGKSAADRYFSEFFGSFNFFWQQTLPDDTLTDSSLLLHCELGKQDFSHVFAVSALLNVNKHTLMVTLPYGMTDDELSQKIRLYNAFLSDRYMPQSIAIARITSPNSMDLQPFEFRYIEPNKTP
jgi:hypothetical protein